MAGLAIGLGLITFYYVARFDAESRWKELGEALPAAGRFRKRNSPAATYPLGAKGSRIPKPAAEARHPARHSGAVVLVLPPEPLAQVRLFRDHDEGMDKQEGCHP